MLRLRARVKSLERPISGPYQEQVTAEELLFLITYPKETQLRKPVTAVEWAIKA